MCFVGSEFPGSHHRTPHAFLHFLDSTVGVYEPVQAFHPRGCRTLLASTHHTFFPCYVTVRLCWTSSNGTEPTHQSPSMVIDHNHALTPIQCNVSLHMHNTSLHVISCHMYNECYMDNSNHTIHHVLWTIIL